MKKPIIQFENFTFKYDSQVEPSLHHINLTIYEGEKVLIIGPSGSGKSTLGHCLNGLIPFSYKGESTGSLKVNEIETKTADIFSLSKEIGTVLQDTDGQFIGMTVAEDIAFALENDVRPQDEMFTIVEDAANLVDINTHLHHSIHELSGGQKQRVSIAGIMVDDVKVLLFDEPLANLDPATGKYAIQLIDRIQNETNTTVVIIEHRLEDVLEYPVDRIIVMKEGRIVADMPPNKLLASNLLDSCYLREPLYVKAAKYAGIDITEDMQPTHMDTFQFPIEKIQSWYEAVPQVETSLKMEPLLHLEDIQFSYPGARIPIIKNLSFTIHKGEMVSIAGKNGAGKSTLASLICGFVRPQSGKILLNGQDITKDTIKERAERIGLVMQNPNQMITKHLIFDEVAIGLVLRGVPEDEIKQRVENTLKICGLFPYRNWPISALSFGQKKRVTIASMLILEPELLILDEPTAGQDFKHYTEVMDFLTELNEQGITILMITHDMHLMLEYTPRAIVMSDGQKIADDTAANILTNSVVVEQANLKETSLYPLAIKAGLSNPGEFVNRFIAYDRSHRKTW